MNFGREDKAVWVLEKAGICWTMKEYRWDEKGLKLLTGEIYAVELNYTWSNWRNLVFDK